ncbi:MAG TPA: chemotaxis-specific protein-glutamate methyltransferase CheB [Polyangiaceae bacterium]|nr:chemotaxis-specific protein-glutamate methyltransferase CheB [Polyangiaceae bacterium]
MPPIRVLIVDDSLVIRKLLEQVLQADAAIQVAASLSLGSVALEKLPSLKPDLVILDIEMPELDGLQTLTLIRKSWPRLPVIMFSSHTGHGARATLEALSRGASDYVPKPSHAGGLAPAMERVRQELLPKIHALVPRGRSLPMPPASTPATAAGAAPTGRLAPAKGRPAPSSASGPKHPPHPPPSNLPAFPPSCCIPETPPQSEARTVAVELPVSLVVMGASTGGPQALAYLLPLLPADLPVPVVVVQHMLPSFTRAFAERLALSCRLRVVEPDHGAALAPATIHIARGDYHLRVSRRGRDGFVSLDQAPPENYCRPAVDVTFDSAASAYGAGVLAVVLTGMGQDGLRGATLVRAAGGNVIAQDEATSVVWGMPGFVTRAGLASQVLPLDRIAPEVERLVALHRAPYRWANTP